MDRTPAGGGSALADPNRTQAQMIVCDGVFYNPSAGTSKSSPQARAQTSSSRNIMTVPRLNVSGILRGFPAFKRIPAF